MQASPSFPPVYLLEIMSEPDGDIKICDNFARLELAVEQALGHVRSVGVDAEPEAEVSFDEAHEMNGISFFNGNGERLAAISVYHLDRDTADASDLTVQQACRGDRQQLQESLNRLLYV
jgi:hypothetical protein